MNPVVPSTLRDKDSKCSWSKGLQVIIDEKSDWSGRSANGLGVADVADSALLAEAEWLNGDKRSFIRLESRVVSLHGCRVLLRIEMRKMQAAAEADAGSAPQRTVLFNGSALYFACRCSTPFSAQIKSFSGADWKNSIC